MIMWCDDQVTSGDISLATGYEIRLIKGNIWPIKSQRSKEKEKAAREKKNSNNLTQEREAAAVHRARRSFKTGFESES